MLQYILYLFCVFVYKTYNTVFMFEIFHAQSKASLKANLALR